MNVMLLTDLEGISGITDIGYMDRSSEKYREGCQMLEDTINFVGKTCIEAGVEKVYYLDGHGGGGNVNPSNIDSYIKKVSLIEWQELLKMGEIDCQFEIGAHAKAGTIGGFLDHTISSRHCFKHKINDKEVGEVELHAILCGAYDVPVVLCSGDDIVCEQVANSIPGIYTAPIKKSNKRNLCEDKKDGFDILKKAVEEAILGYNEIKPIKISLPFTVSITYYRSDMCEEIYERCSGNVRRVDARTLEKEIDKIVGYNDLKIYNF